MVAYPVQIPPPNPRLQLVDPKTGILTYPGLQFLQRLWSQVVDTNQVIPCTVTNSGNNYTLTPFPVPPTGDITGYSDYSIFTTVWNFTSTGLVTAQVNALGLRKVYIGGGSAQAGAGQLVAGLLNLVIYNSALDGGNGGFVLK